MLNTPYWNRSEDRMETTETLGNAYATREMRDINPYHLFRDRPAARPARSRCRILSQSPTKIRGTGRQQLSREIKRPAERHWR